jgi:hypothetical protein
MDLFSATETGGWMCIGRERGRSMAGDIAIRRGWLAPWLCNRAPQRDLGCDVGDQGIRGPPRAARMCGC